MVLRLIFIFDFQAWNGFRLYLVKDAGRVDQAQFDTARAYIGQQGRIILVSGNGRARHGLEHSVLDAIDQRAHLVSLQVIEVSLMRGRFVGPDYAFAPTVYGHREVARLTPLFRTEKRPRHEVGREAV